MQEREKQTIIINHFKFIFMENEQIKVSKIFKGFMLVKNEEGKIVIVMGKYKVHEKTFDTFDQAERFIGYKPYDLIFNAMLCLLQQKEDYEKETKKAKKTAKATKADTKDN